MKEQPIETRENGIEHSVGQRPIHATYEPPGPLPEFRARPKLSQVQPARKETSCAINDSQTRTERFTGGSR